MDLEDFEALEDISFYNKEFINEIDKELWNCGWGIDLNNLKNQLTFTLQTIDKNNEYYISNVEHINIDISDINMSRDVLYFVEDTLGIKVKTPSVEWEELL